MQAFLLPNGRLLIPRRAEGPGGLIGDGMVEIGPEDPTFAQWLPFASVNLPKKKPPSGKP